jgi:hypothetical protein
MANENILNASDELLQVQAERDLPGRAVSIPPVRQPMNPPLSPPQMTGQGPNIVEGQGQTAPLDVRTEGQAAPALTDQQRIDLEISRFANPASPVPYRPYNYILPQPPQALFLPGEGMSNDLDFLNQQQQAPEQLQAGDYRPNFRPNQLQLSPQLVEPVEVPWQYDYDSVVSNAIQNRANRVMNQTVAPGTNVPLTGVARALNSGQPFQGAQSNSPIEFFRRTFGVDFSGASTTENEAVAAPNLFDRVLGRVDDVAANAVTNGGLGIVRSLAGLLPPAVRDVIPFVGEDGVNIITDDSIGAGRRILQTFANVAAQRAQQRIDEVGLPSFVGENTLGRIPNPNNYVRSLSNSIRRRENPIQPFFGPTEFVGTGINRVENGDLSFFEEAITQSPDLRNLLRDLAPVINEAGEVGFNPSTGHFGEFGQAGSLSAALWLMNIPEGLLQGAMYDISDTVRYVAQNERIQNYLRRNPNFAEFLDTFTTLPPEDNLRRLDTLGALFGRDYGFTQPYTEDRYLAIIGNPNLSFIPQGYGLQAGLGFVLDMAAGGLTDTFAVDPLFDALSGARRGASNTIQTAAEAAVRGPNWEPIQRLPNWEPLQRIVRNSEAGSPPTRIQVDVPTVIQRVNNAPPQRVVEATNNAVNRSLVYTNPAPNPARLVPEPDTGARSVTNAAVFDPEQMLRRNAIRRERVLRALEERDNLRFAREFRELSVVPRRVANLSDVADKVDFIRRVPTPEVTPNQAANFASATRALREYATNPNVVDVAPAVIRNAELTRNALLPLIDPETSIAIVKRDLAVANNVIEIPESSAIVLRTTNVPTNEIDVVSAVAAPVPLRSVTPREVSSLPEALLTYRVDVDAIPASSFVPVRRDNASIVNLARFHGVDVNLFDETSNLNRISNINRLESLSFADKNLFGTYGKPIHPNINSPINRVDLSQYDGGVTVSVVPEGQLPAAMQPLPDPPALPGEVGRAALKEGRQGLNGLAKEYAKARKAVAKALESDSLEALDEAHQTIRSIQARVSDVYARHPQLAVDDATKALPVELSPIGETSRMLVEPYIVAQREFFFESRLLQELREELARADELIAQQQEVLSRLPRLERLEVHNELATARRFNPDFQRAGTAEGVQPTRNIRSRRLSDSASEGQATVSVESLRRADELDGASEGQATQMIADAVESTPQEVRRREAVQAITEAGGVNGEMVPIFELRERPPFAGLSRAEQDEIFFDLQRNNIVDLTTIQEVTSYTDEQITQGIKSGSSFMDDETGQSFILFYASISEDYVPDAAASVARQADASPADRVREAYRRLDTEGLNFRVRLDELRDASGLSPEEFRRTVEDMPDMSLLGAEDLQEVRRYGIEPVVDYGSDDVRYFGFMQTPRDEPQRPGLLYYHGTKADSLDVSAHSLTSELGPGLYLTPDEGEAFNYARAKPAIDLVDSADLRPRFTNQGRVFAVDVPTDARILRTDVDADVDVIKDTFREQIKEILPGPTLRRFDSWRRRHPVNQWWHYIRSQFLKEQQSQLNYIRFTENVRDRLVQEGYDGVGDGHVLNLFSGNRVVLGSTDDVASDGSLMEGLLYRYKVDQELQARVTTTRNKQATSFATTEAILEQDRLAIDTFSRQQLAEQVITQERRTVEATRRMGRMEIDLDNAVHIDRGNAILKQLDDAQAEASRDAGRMIREQALDDFCP